jgi:hypothetical protein
MVRISSIRPEDDVTKRRPTPKITWNNKTEASLIEQGFGPSDNNNKDGKYEEPPQINIEEKRFLSEVDTRQGPILRQVTHIIRQKAIDWSSEKRERKEYITYHENWYGVNWLGVKIAPATGHIEGVFEATTKNLELDKNTGQGLYYKMGRRQQTYYLPFSKKTVDQIIAGHYNDPKDSVRYINNKDNIHYIVKFGSEDSPAGQMRYGQRTEFSYDQFATWTFSDLYKMATRPWGNQDPNYGPGMSSYK